MAFSKRKLTYFCLGVFFLMEGIEYAVILPTLWLYIQSKFHAEEWFFGMVLSAFSFSGLFAGPIMGRWSDKTGKSKFIILFSMLWEIGGNFMYFVSTSKYFVLGGRLIAGVGIGGDAVILSEITKGTSEDERTGILSILIALRQFGLVAGPGFNVFLRLCNFNIGPFLIDKYTAPGAFMCLCWILVAVLFLLFYHGLAQEDLNKSVLSDSNISSPSIYSSEEVQRNINNKSGEETVSDACHEDGVIDTSIQSNTDSLIRQAEIVITSTDDEIYQRMTKARENNIANHSSLVNSERQPAESEKSSTLLFLYNEYIREEVVVVLAIIFNSIFNQLSLEAMVTPLTVKYLNFSELSNSIMFCIAGAEIIIVFIIVRKVSRRFKDRTLLVFGYCLLGFSVGVTMYTVVTASAGQTAYMLPKFIFSIAVYAAAFPFLLICSISLYSKITRKETQGLSQGIRKVVVGIGTILAPLWAGSTISKPYLLFGVLIGLLSISFIMILLSFKKLVPLSELKASKIESEQLDQDDEKQPLLA